MVSTEERIEELEREVKRLRKLIESQLIPRSALICASCGKKLKTPMLMNVFGMVVSVCPECRYKYSEEELARRIMLRARHVID